MVWQVYSGQLTVDLHHSYEVIVYDQSIVDGIKYVTGNLKVKNKDPASSENQSEAVKENIRALGRTTLAYMDDDGNGLLSEAEYAALDSDHDGNIDKCSLSLCSLTALCCALTGGC